MSRLPAILILALTLLLVAPAGAPQATSSPQPQAPAAQAPPPQVQGYTLPPEKYEQAVAYARARYILYFLSFAWGLLVLLLVLRWRLAARFRDWAERAVRFRFLQAWIFVPLFLLTLGVLELPPDLYGQWLSRHYQQSVQGWGSWAWDWTKGQLLGFVLGSLLIWLLYAVIRRSPRFWWLWFWLAALPILVFLLLITPMVIEPLFFKFEPLQKEQPLLTSEIQKVVHRGGLVIPDRRMFEMKASEKMKSLNAYVTGLGASKRVVVYDTTIQKMTVPEILFVFGHEMGHYVLDHVWKGIAFAAAVLLLFLYLGYRALGWTLARRGARWGIRGVDDWASLPVLLLWLSIFGFLFSPVSASFSRYLEHQADIYGLEVTHGLVADPQQNAAQAFQILGEVNLDDPDPNPFIRVWLYDHPPLNERIQFVLHYDPWAQGKEPEFVK
ncbi:MAG TPA: M48 family metallopeptidase [Terriglobales bacterium]|nr:M48 family metallopeptidase [Terriglobales bacterium]